MAICTAEGAHVRAHRAPEREDATRPEAREKSSTCSEQIGPRWTTALGSAVGREARSPQNLGKLRLFRQDTFPDREATAGAAATLSGRGDGPTRGPAENRLATAVRARTVRAERPDKVFQRVTVNIGKRSPIRFQLGTILRIVRNLDPKPRTCPYPHTHTHPHAAEPRGNTTCHTAVGSKGGQGAEGGSGKHQADRNVGNASRTCD